MSRSQAARLAGLLALWLCAATAAAAFASDRLPPSWLTSAAAIVSAAAAAYAVGMAAGRAGARSDAPRLARAAAVALPAALILTAATGGLSSPAVIVCALATLALAARRPVAAMVGAGAVTFGAIALLHVLTHRSVALGELVTAATLFGGLAVAPAWHARRAAQGISRVRERSRAVDRFFDARSYRRAGKRIGTTPPHGHPLAAQNVERHQLETVRAYLAQVRERFGADEVVFWRFTGNGDELAAAAWVTASGRPPANPALDERSSLVTWSATARMAQCGGGGPTPAVAAAPALDERESVGAISVSAKDGLRGTREEIKDALPRYAGHAALLGRLLRERQDASQHNRHMAAILHAAHDLQSKRSPEELGRAVCETALRVTFGTRAAIVRWNPESGGGEVQSVTDGHPVSVATPVTGDSQVAAVCRSRLPEVWEDARGLSPAVPIYGEGEARRNVGSLALVPLKRAADVIGAIVVEGDAPGDVLVRDTRHVRLLAALAELSLAAVWDLEEVAERARTDQLTGLANRRQFDEHLVRMLNEVDRFGGSVSLLIADIDFFKRVNDTHGHDVGDAVLRAVAATMKERTRTVDICARFGGEEIAVLLPQTPVAGAVEVAERMRRAIAARPIGHKGVYIPVTASFGVATYPDTARSHDGLFPAADRALYRAKSDGRNCVKCAPVIRSTKTT